MTIASHSSPVPTGATSAPLSKDPFPTPPGGRVEPPARVSVMARLDRIPALTRSHYQWMALLGFFFAFDLVDLNTFAYAAPALRSEWGLSIDDVGHISSIGFAGMFLGAVVGGRLSDRFGRRPVLLSAVVVFSVFSLLSAAAQNEWQLATLRFLTGVGLQAMTGVLLVWVSEMYPARIRGRSQSLILALGFIGVPIVAFTARAVVPIGPGYWRWVFVIGGVGLLGGLVALKRLPESLRWQSQNGHEEQAEALIARLEAEAVARTGTALPEPVERPMVPQAKLADLFRRGNLRRLVATTLVCVFLILCFYGFNAWVPTLLAANGYTTSQALNYSSILSIAAVPGALLAIPIIDRFDRRRVLLGIETVVAAMLLVFGLVDNAVTLVISGFLATMLLQCGVAVIYTYIAEVFPTSQRGLGAGIANGSGRLAGVIGATVVGWVFTGLGFTAVFVYLAIAAVLMGLVLAIAGDRTTQVALDSVGVDREKAA